MNHGAPFTANEDAYLIAHYQDIETAAMAQHLGRTISSTQNRLRHLNLRKRPSRRPLQEKKSIFLDLDLVDQINKLEEWQGISFSARVQEAVRIGIKRMK